MRQMQVWTLGLLVASLGLAGCGSCASGGKGKGTGNGSKAKAKADGEGAEVAPPPPPKDTITHVVYQAKDEALIWSESRSGTRGTKVDQSFWLGTGYAIRENEAYRYSLADGVDYLSLTAPTGAGVQPMSAVVAGSTQAPPAYAWSVEVAPNGFHRVFIKPPVGERQRIGMYPDAPSAPTWLEATLPAATNAAPPLSKSSGWLALEGGAPGFQNVLPQGATPLATTDAPPEALAAWAQVLPKLRGGAVEIKLAKVADLDRDGAPETFLCVSGGRNAPCYVVDKAGEEERFYVTTLPWDGTNPALQPLFFQIGADAYVALAEPPSDTGKAGALSVVRFNGAGFLTDTLR